MSKFNRRLALLLTSLMSLGSISNSMAMKNSEMDSLIPYGLGKRSKLVLKARKIKEKRDRILSPLRERQDNLPLTDDWYRNYSIQDFVLPIKGNEDYCIVVNFTMSSNPNSVMGYSYNEETGKPEWKELNCENWKQNTQLFITRELLGDIYGMPIAWEDKKLLEKIKELGIAGYSKMLFEKPVALCNSLKAKIKDLGRVGCDYYKDATKVEVGNDDSFHKWLTIQLGTVLLTGGAVKGGFTILDQIAGNIYQEEDAEDDI